MLVTEEDIRNPLTVRVVCLYMFFTASFMFIDWGVACNQVAVRVSYGYTCSFLPFFLSLCQITICILVNRASQKEVRNPFELHLAKGLVSTILIFFRKALSALRHNGPSSARRTPHQSKPQVVKK